MAALSLIGVTSLLYATFAPLFVLLLVGVLFIPCLLSEKKTLSPLEVGRAIVGYLFLCIGTALLGSGLLPLLFLVLAQQPVANEARWSLALITIVGTTAIVLSRQWLRRIDPEAQVIPRAIVYTSFLLTGLLLCLLGSLLLLIVGFSKLGQPLEAGLPTPWWPAPAILLAAGVVLTALSSSLMRGKSLPSLFSSLPLPRRKS